MNELEALQQSLGRARQEQADTEFAREIAGRLVATLANAVQDLPVDKLRILDAYLNKSLELVGAAQAQEGGN
jgi:hypothetical protein